MSEPEGLVPWLRALLEYDLEGWRSRERAYLPRAEHEDKYLYARAREHAARCEAELAVLDEHYILTRDDRNEAYEEFSVVTIGGANKGFGCVTCHYYGQGGVKGYGYCRTVRLVGYGYRFRPGYREAEWKP